MPEQSKRLHPKRYVRSRNPKPMRLQQEDIEILRLVAKYRYLNATEISQLLGLRRKVVRYPAYKAGVVDELRGERAIKRRLQLMFAHGLLSRPPKQQDALYAQGQLIHALGNGGADVLAERGSQFAGSGARGPSACSGSSGVAAITSFQRRARRAWSRHRFKAI